MNSVQRDVDRNDGASSIRRFPRRGASVHETSRGYAQEPSLHSTITSARGSTPHADTLHAEKRKPPYSSSPAARRKALPFEFRSERRRSPEPHAWPTTLAADTSMESDASFHGQVGRSRTPARELRSATVDRPASRTAGRSGRISVDVSSMSRYLGQAARERSFSTSYAQPNAVEHSPTDAARQRKVSTTSTRSSASELHRASSRNSMRRAHGRDVFDDAPPLPSSSRHPLSPVYSTMEMLDLSTSERPHSSARARGTTLEELRARIDDLTGSSQRPYSRASSRLSREPSHFSSTPSHSHVASSVTSIRPSAEPHHKARTHHDRATTEATPESVRANSTARNQASSRLLASRDSTLSEHHPVTPDTSLTVGQRPSSRFATPASASQSHTSNRPSLASSAKSNSTPLHARNLHSSVDAVERHILGFMDIESALQSMPEHAVMIMKLKETSILALDMNNDLRDISKEVLEHQIDAEIGSSRPTDFAAAFAQLDKSLSSLLRLSDEHVRNLTDGLMALTRIDRGKLTTSKSAEENVQRPLTRPTLGSTDTGRPQAGASRRASLDIRRSIPANGIVHHSPVASRTTSGTPSERSSVSSSSRSRVSTAVMRPEASIGSPADASSTSAFAPSPTPSAATARNRARGITSRSNHRLSMQSDRYDTQLSRRTTIGYSARRSQPSTGDNLSMHEQSHRYHRKGDLAEPSSSPPSSFWVESRASKSSGNSVHTVRGMPSSFSPRKPQPSHARVSTTTASVPPPGDGFSSRSAAGAVEGLLLHVDSTEPASNMSASDGDGKGDSPSTSPNTWQRLMLRRPSMKAMAGDAQATDIHEGDGGEAPRTISPINVRKMSTSSVMTVTATAESPYGANLADIGTGTGIASSGSVADKPIESDALNYVRSLSRHGGSHSVRGASESAAQDPQQ